jgi:hypothetical protein
MAELNQTTEDSYTSSLAVEPLPFSLSAAERRRRPPDSRSACSSTSPLARLRLERTASVFSQSFTLSMSCGSIYILQNVSFQSLAQKSAVRTRSLLSGLLFAQLQAMTQSKYTKEKHHGAWRTTVVPRGSCQSHPRGVVIRVSQLNKQASNQQKMVLPLQRWGRHTLPLLFTPAVLSTSRLSEGFSSLCGSRPVRDLFIKLTICL